MLNKYFLILLGLLLSFYILPLFRDGIFLTHDGENHMARIASFTDAVLDGQFPVRWAGELNYSYGSPVFIFFYPLPYIVSFFPHVIGIDIINTFKIILSLSFILSFGTFYLFIRNFVRKEIAIFGSVLYFAAPYHLLNLYVRGDIGELIAYMIVPLVFYSIESFKKKQDFLKVVFGGIFYSLLVLSHNGVSLLFTPIILFYVLFFTHGNKNKLILSALVPMGLVISGFFWIPAIIESTYTNAKLFVGDFFQGNFIPGFFNTIHSAWGFGADINSPDGLAPQFGIFYFVLLLVAFVLFYKFKKATKSIYFWAGVFGIGIFLTLPISEILWRNIPIVKLFQFPWRMIVLGTFAGIVLISLGFNNIKNQKTIVAVLLICILSTIPFIQTRGYTHRPDSFYNSFPGTTYFHGEATTIWTAGDPSGYPPKPIEIISGDGEINITSLRSNLHEFTTTSTSELKILDNTHYFPGWRVYVDGMKVPVEFQSGNERGLITFLVPGGKHLVEVKFGETKIRLLADMLSVIGILGFFVLVFMRKEIRK